MKKNGKTFYVGVSSNTVKEFNKKGLININEKLKLIEVYLNDFKIDKKFLEFCREIKNRDIILTAHAPYATSKIEDQVMNLAFISKRNFKVMKKVFSFVMLWR